VAFQAVPTTFFIITVFRLLGSVISNLLDIALPACRIAGGVEVALIGATARSGSVAVQPPFNLLCAR